MDKDGWKVRYGVRGKKWSSEMVELVLRGKIRRTLSLAAVISLMVLTGFRSWEKYRDHAGIKNRLDRIQCLTKNIDPRILDAFHQDWVLKGWDASVPVERTGTPMPELTKPASMYESKKENKHLWSAFGAPTTPYGARNTLFVQLLQKVGPKRVFEFAGNGGFLMQKALMNCDLLDTMKHWIHAEFSRPVLDYATFLVSHEEILYSPNLNPDQIKPDDWHVPLPFATMLPNAQPSVSVDIIHLDFSNAEQVRTSLNLNLFDTFATISFEHFYDDIGIIRRLPVGANFLFCVPNFGGPEHFRKFRNKEEIKSRYGEALDIVEIVQMRYLWTKKKFIVWGIVRPHDGQEKPE